MPRNISFMLTTPQFLNGTKDVTRRMFWLADIVIEWVITSFWTKREFLSFVWERLKAKRDTGSTTP